MMIYIWSRRTAPVNPQYLNDLVGGEELHDGTLIVEPAGLLHVIHGHIHGENEITLMDGLPSRRLRQVDPLLRVRRNALVRTEAHETDLVRLVNGVRAAQPPFSIGQIFELIDLTLFRPS